MSAKNFIMGRGRGLEWGPGPHGTISGYAPGSRTGQKVAVAVVRPRWGKWTALVVDADQEPIFQKLYSSQEEAQQAADTYWAELGYWRWKSESKIREEAQMNAKQFIMGQEKRPVKLLPIKAWPPKRWKHVYDNIMEWPGAEDRMEVLRGLKVLNEIGVYVYAGALWWIPMPAYFVLVGSSDIPSTMLKPDETPGGERINNPALDAVSLANWRTRLHDSRYQGLLLVAQLLCE
jgi:hypothetical protein